MKIKVCGITAIEQLVQLEEAAIDYAGLIFYEGSKRNAGEKIKNEKAKIRKIAIKKVGVFVNADLQNILNIIDDYGLYAVQLHGDETPEFCTKLMDIAKVIKVFRIGDNINIDEVAEPFQNACHFFLFDRAPDLSPTNSNQGRTAIPQPLLKKNISGNMDISKSEVNAKVTSSVGGGREEIVYGGTGKKFNWSILQNSKINKPFFLSGGIGLEDVEKIKTFHHTFLYGVDVNSCFEKEPGVKDIQKIKRFVKALNHG